MKPASISRTLEFLQLTAAGRTYVQRFKLQGRIIEAIQTALNWTKNDVADFIRTYWPRKTGTLVDDACNIVMRHAYYTLHQTPKLEIGSNVFYLEYLLDMADRMATGYTDSLGRVYGPGIVHWTNPNTRVIEDDILGNTVNYAKVQFPIRLRKSLIAYNLAWMFGEGRIPDAIRNPQFKNNQLRAGYRGKGKPLQLKK